MSVESPAERRERWDAEVRAGRELRVLGDKLAVLAELHSTLQSQPADDPACTALDQLQLLRMIAATAESAQRQMVAKARDEGASWEQIAKALGVTRQSAHERYS